MDAGLFVVVLTTLFGYSQTVTLHILPPTHTQGTQAALVIVSGAGIKGDAYKPLGLEIQKSSYLRLWVVILGNFIDNIPNPPEVEEGVTKAVQLIRMQGMTSDNIFLAGHSLGGIMAGEYGKNSRKVKGILLWASYLTKQTSLSSYPLPVLTVAGDLDGLTRITRIADTFQKLKKNLTRSMSSIYRTPVITLKGVNHGQFASGTMPPEVVKHDLDPEVNLTVAHALIARYSNDFMVSVLQEPQSNVTLARNDLKQAYNFTDDIMKPLLDMKSLDENEQESSGWSLRAQEMAVVDIPIDLKIINEEKEIPEFIKSEPRINTLGSVRTVETLTHVEISFHPLDTSIDQTSPRQLEVKMKSREAILKSVSSDGKYGTNRTLTCRDINEAAFTLALTNSSVVAKERYKTRVIRPMIFKNDVQFKAGVTWVAWKLKLEETDSALEVTSGSLRTHVDFPIPALAGMFYCKLLSPYRAMEWVYVDSLRK